MKGYFIKYYWLLIILAVFVCRIKASQPGQKSKDDDSLKAEEAGYSDETDYENGYEDEDEEETKTDILAALKQKLGIPPRSKVFRSSKKNEEKKKVEAEVNSLVVCSLLKRKQSGSEAITICLPNSVEKCRQENQREETPETADIETKCDVNIPELNAKRHSLEKMLKEDSKLFLKYKKGTRPPSMDPTFRKAATKLAEKHLIAEKSYKIFIAKIATLKCYLNAHLVDYAVTLSTLARQDCSSDIPNPIEVDDVFFNKPHKEYERNGENDYNLFMSDGHHKILGTGDANAVRLSGDPEESKLDYHREDSMFHAFHALFHRIFDSLIQRRYTRTFELFFYTHQQMMRRTAIERHVQGLKPVVPLDPQEFRKPLGPGYTPGWYAWRGLGGRKDDCAINSFNSSYIDIMAEKYAEMMENMTKISNFEEFGKSLEKWYHTSGHTYIAKACSNIYDVTADTGMGVMSYSEVSGRDPIFYRWHTHIEEIVQQFRDRKLARYTKGDFMLSDGVEVVSVKTLIDKDKAATEKDVKNLLITHWEHKQIRHDQTTTISYNRLNHLDFKYQIQIKNQNQVKRKVFIRLWLGILLDKNGSKTHDPNSMIEMDQFAHTLSGSAEETIARLSVQSAVTMKDVGTTILSLMEDIELNKANRTWCGYPHNLLVPRSNTYKPEEKDLGGKLFVLMVFVTNTQHDVTAGSDGVEHMMCGHKDLDTALDKKSFGFPFDRKISFRLKPEYNFVTMTDVKIIYRPEQYNQKDMGERLDMMEEISKSKTVFEPSVTEAPPLVIDPNPTTQVGKIEGKQPPMHTKNSETNILDPSHFKEATSLILHKNPASQLSSRGRKQHQMHRPKSEPKILILPNVTEATPPILGTNPATEFGRRDTNHHQLHHPKSEQKTQHQASLIDEAPLSIDPALDNKNEKINKKEKNRGESTRHTNSKSRYRSKRTWDDVWKMLLQLLKEKPNLANQWLKTNKFSYKQ